MIRRLIYWHETEGDVRQAEVHYLVTYNQGTIDDYRDMAKELRKTFPQAKDGEIKCGSVTESSECFGATIIAWSSKLKYQDYGEYRNVTPGRREEYRHTAC